MNARLQWIIDYITDGGVDVDTIAAVAEGQQCPHCEATPGDNEYCVMDGARHPWVTCPL